MDRVLADEIEYDRINTANDILYEQQLADFKFDVWDLAIIYEHHIDKATGKIPFTQQAIEDILEALEEIEDCKGAYSNLGNVDSDIIWKIIWENPSW